MTDADFQNEPNEFLYVGFWARFFAFIVDNVLFSAAILFLPLPGINKESFSLSTETMNSVANSWSSSVTMDSMWGYLLPMIIVLLFWHFRSATPGKMIFKAKVVDAKTGEKLTTKQSIIRYLGYFLSAFFFFIGFLWIGFDKRKQGFHDKLSGSVVIYSK